MPATLNAAMAAPITAFMLSLLVLWVSCRTITSGRGVDLCYVRDNLELGHIVHAEMREILMFVVTEAEATAIRAAFEQRGELSAVVELRRRFPGITDNRQARECVRTIASWKPIRLLPQPAGDRSPRPTQSGQSSSSAAGGTAKK
jgi:hypothetical protein